MKKVNNAYVGIYAIAIAIILITYNGLYAFSYFPITEGWFSEYATLIRLGEVPHRDFHLLLSPFYPLIIAVLQTLFGEAYLPLRIFGLGVIAGIGVALFFLLRGFLGNPSAAFASLSATIYYQSGNAFLGYDFTQFLTLFLLLGALSATSALSLRFEAERSDSRQRIRFFLSGLFFACAFLTKHSNGGIATLLFSLFALLVGIRIMSLRELARNFLWSCGGFMIPVFSIVLWITIAGGFTGMVHDLFIDAAAAKGGLVVILTNWMQGLFGGDYQGWSRESALRLSRLALTCLLLALPFILINIVLSIRQSQWRIDRSLIVSNLKAASSRQPAGDITLAICLALLFLAALSNVYTSLRLGWGFIREVYDATYPILIITSLNFCLYGLIFLTALLLVRPSHNLIRLTMVTAFGLALIMGNGTSAGLSEISAFIGYAVFSGLIFRAALPWRLAVFPILFFGLAMSSALMDERYQKPYHWWRVETGDIRQQVCAHLDGIFKGICLAPDQAAKLSRIGEIIQTHAGKHDEIFVYPHMPVFYLMTDRKPFEGAVVSWFDFMSDNQARKLAQSLEKTPPKLLIYAMLPDEVASTHERLFRAGAPSGQRKIVEAFNTMRKNGIRCRLEDIHDVNGLNLAVLVPCSGYDVQRQPDHEN